MNVPSDASSSLLGAAAVLLGDAAGSALHLSAVAMPGDSVDHPSEPGVDLSGHLSDFLGTLRPTVVSSLQGEGSDSAVDGQLSSGSGLSDVLSSLVGGDVLRLVLPEGGERLGALDPMTTMLHHLEESGSMTALTSHLSSAEMANIAKAGSGPMLVAVLAVEAGIEQILKKLREIDGKIDEILKGVERQRTARLRGTISYLTDIAGSIQLGNLSSESVVTFSGELENTDREARGFSEEYRSILEEQIEAFEKLDIAGANLDIDDDVKSIRAAMAKVEDALRGLLLSLSVRMITMRIRSLLPIEQGSTKQRVEHLEREIGGAETAIATVERVLREKADDIHGIRQEVMDKTGAVLGGASSLVGKAFGKKLTGLVGGAGKIVEGAVTQVGKVLDGSAGVEEARKNLMVEFAQFQNEVADAIRDMRSDGERIGNARGEEDEATSKRVLDLYVGEGDKVYVRGVEQV